MKSIEEVQDIRRKLINSRNRGFYFPLFSDRRSLTSPDATYIRAIEAYRDGESKRKDEADILAKIQEILSTLDNKSLEYYATLFYYNELVGKSTDIQKDYLSKLNKIEVGGLEPAYEFSSLAYKADNVEEEYLAENIRDILLNL